MSLHAQLCGPGKSEGSSWPGCLNPDNSKVSKDKALKRHCPGPPRQERDALDEAVTLGPPRQKAGATICWRGKEPEALKGGLQPVSHVTPHRSGQRQEQQTGRHRGSPGPDSSPLIEVTWSPRPTLSPHPPLAHGDLLV